MIVAFYVAAGLIMALGSLYFAWHSPDFCKFLAGAFFVSSGTFYLAGVSVPLLGTGFVETPEISGARGRAFRPVSAVRLFRLRQEARVSRANHVKMNCAARRRPHLPVTGGPLITATRRIGRDT